MPTAGQACTSPENCCAPKALAMSATWKVDTNVDNRCGSRAARRISLSTMPSRHVRSIEAGVPIKVLDWCAFRVLRADAQMTASDSITDLKGKRVGVWALNRPPARALTPHGGLCRARSRQRHPVGHEPTAPIRRNSSSMGRVDAFLAGPPEPRSCAPRRSATRSRQHCRRPPVVAVFLLHGCRQSRTM